MTTSEIKWRTMYNLADMIRFNQRGKLLRCPKDTIGNQYIKRHKGVGLDFGLLQEIVRERATPMPSSTFVLHARIGDCLDRCPPVGRFVDIIREHGLSERFDTCNIYSGGWSHKGGRGRAGSQVYINELTEGIKGLGLSCSLVSESVDGDFTALATAPCFVVGYRGFSWLAASINPNEVIWDSQNPPDFKWLSHGNAEKLNQLIAGYENQRSLGH